MTPWWRHSDTQHAGLKTKQLDLLHFLIYIKYLKHHFLSDSRWEAHAVVGAAEEAIKVRLSVEEPEINLQESLNVSDVLQDPEQRIII